MFNKIGDGKNIQLLIIIRFRGLCRLCVRAARRKLVENRFSPDSAVNV